MLRYIVTIAGQNSYGFATYVFVRHFLFDRRVPNLNLSGRSRSWTGISADIHNIFDGPDKTLVSKEWIAENIQIGPLGAKYPTYKFIMEGDTPAYLGIIPVSDRP